MKETPIHKLRYPETGDPDTLALYWQHQAEDAERELGKIDPGQVLAPGGAGDAGKLLIVGATGATAAKAMKGDATIASDGTLTIGAKKVLESMLADGAATSPKTKLTTETKVSSAPLVLTEAYKDIEGTTYEVTPSVACKLFLVASFRMLCTSGATAVGTVGLDGVDQTDEARLTPESGKIVSATVSEIYVLSLTVAKHTIKLRGKRETGSGECLKAKFAGFLVAS